MLGFDFGLRRIGVAVGSGLTGRAQALIALSHHESGPDWLAIEKLMDEWQPSRIIVGLPGTLDGRETEMSVAARQFATDLHERFDLPVELVDEQLSSAAARDELLALRRSGQRRRRVKKADIDPVAARLILETWLNQQAIRIRQDQPV